MGLFDDYFDEKQFNSGDGLLGRLLALQQSQDLYAPSNGLDAGRSIQSLPAGTPSPAWPGYGPLPGFWHRAASDGSKQNQTFWPSDNTWTKDSLSAQTLAMQPHLTAAGGISLHLGEAPASSDPSRAPITPEKNSEVAGKSLAKNGSSTTFPICQLPDGSIVSFQDLGGGLGMIGGSGNGGLGFRLGTSSE